jgi:hypothetical protein
MKEVRRRWVTFSLPEVRQNIVQNHFELVFPECPYSIDTFLPSSKSTAKTTPEPQEGENNVDESLKVGTDATDETQSMSLSRQTPGTEDSVSVTDKKEEKKAENEDVQPQSESSPMPMEIERNNEKLQENGQSETTPTPTATTSITEDTVKQTPVTRSQRKVKPIITQAIKVSPMRASPRLRKNERPKVASPVTPTVCILFSNNM